MEGDRELMNTFFKDKPHLTATTPARQSADKENDEESCPAFGFLRGLHDRALALEFRLRNGNSETFSYQLLASWKFNPSIGLLLKFTSDVTTLVLIRGSNLDVMPPGRAINLTDRGLQRHRITFIREMDEAELKRAGNAQPSVDGIAIEEFQSVETQEEWLRKTATAFL
jgi:hypothetical protein